MSKRDDSEIRIFYAEFKGSNQAFENGLATIGAALRQAVQSPTHIVRAIEVRPDATDEDIVAAAVDQTPDDVFLDNDPVPSGKNGRKRVPASDRDRNATLSIVPDLDLHPEGSPSLDAFLADLNPKKHIEYALAFAYYLQNVLHIESITLNHIFTCFNSTKKTKMPADVPSTVRNITIGGASGKGWLQVLAGNTIKVTTHGANHVEHSMRPKATAE